MRLPERAFLISALLVAGGTAEEAPGPPDPRTLATGLRTASRVSFSKDQWFAWRNPVTCDADGNLFLVVVPPADPRDLKTPPSAARFTRTANDILRVSADGKTTTLIKPDAVPAFAEADAVHTGPLAVDSSGSLYAVVLVTRGETGKQYLVSFDSKGQYSSRLAGC